MARSAGFIVVFNRIPALIAAVEANAQQAPKRVADRIAASARSRAPVQTGALRASIESASVSRGKEAEVRVGAPYAGFVEYGTYKMGARPFLGPAVTEHQEEFLLEIGAPVLGKKI
jgi:HK97 gp10 family phage protein